MRFYERNAIVLECASREVGHVEWMCERNDSKQVSVPAG